MHQKATLQRSDLRTFREALRRFERLIEGQLKGFSCCSGVTLAQCHALLEIESRRSATLNELAQGLGLDKSTLSRTVEGLVNSGLVERTFKDRDRRSLQLCLSWRGKDTCDRINEDNDQLFHRVFERIGSANRQRVLDAFQEIVNAMAAEMVPISISMAVPPARPTLKKGYIRK
jgi:DNA-binding MarR family transcriptional regulator